MYLCLTLSIDVPEGELVVVLVVEHVHQVRVEGVHVLSVIVEMWVGESKYVNVWVAGEEDSTGRRMDPSI